VWGEVSRPGLSRLRSRLAEATLLNLENILDLGPLLGAEVDRLLQLFSVQKGGQVQGEGGGVGKASAVRVCLGENRVTHRQDAVSGAVFSLAPGGGEIHEHLQATKGQSVPFRALAPGPLGTA